MGGRYLSATPTSVDLAAPSANQAFIGSASLNRYASRGNTPPVATSRLPRDCSRPKRDCSSPPRDCSRPPRDCSRPPRDCSRPPGERRSLRRQFTNRCETRTMQARGTKPRTFSTWRSARVTMRRKCLRRAKMHSTLPRRKERWSWRPSCPLWRRRRPRVTSERRNPAVASPTMHATAQPPFTRSLLEEAMLGPVRGTPELDHVPGEMVAAGPVRANSSGAAILEPIRVHSDEGVGRGRELGASAR